MEERIQALLKEISDYKASAKTAVEAFRLKFISKKGVVGELFEELKKVPAEQKKAAGKILNDLKQAAEARFAELNEMADSSATFDATALDLTLPPVPNQTGNLHPLTLTKYR